MKTTDENIFSVSINKKNPKPHAKQYRIETIREFFNVFKSLNQKDREKMLKEFGEVLRAAYTINDLAAARAKAVPGSEHNLDMIKFDWIND